MEAPHGAPSNSNRREGDEADVQRVLDGDLDAFEGIVRRWQGPLVNLAYRYCRDRGMAEEMAQEAFVRAFRSLRKWRGEAKFSTWLFAVALNHYRSALRRYRPPMVELDEARELAGKWGMEEAIERQDHAEWVRRAVSNLPAKYRDTLILYYFHEMDIGETARTLEVAEGTVKARLHRGRELLKRRLEGVLVPHLATESA